VKPVVLNLSIISKTFKSGETVTPAILLEKKLISKISNKIPPVKILATGDLDVKITISGCEVSAAVVSKVESKGGSVTVNTK
jgi:large subunit ribosomal protein L15